MGPEASRGGRDRVPSACLMRSAAPASVRVLMPYVVRLGVLMCVFRISLAISIDYRK